MKYENIELKEGLNKEWIITNGIGGYASSTIIRSKHEEISWTFSSYTYATRKKKFNIIKS